MKNPDLIQPSKTLYYLNYGLIVDDPRCLDELGRSPLGCAVASQLGRPSTEKQIGIPACAFPVPHTA
jgi:hypothetical protein